MWQDYNSAITHQSNNETHQHCTSILLFYIAFKLENNSHYLHPAELQVITDAADKIAVRINTIDAGFNYGQLINSRIVSYSALERNQNDQQ